MRVTQNLLSVAAGFIAGIAVTLAVLSEERQFGISDSEDSQSTEVQDATVEATREASAAPPDKQRADKQNQLRLDPANLPDTPQVYVDLLSPPKHIVTGADVHWTFARETRHEAWAFDVETEIAQELYDKNVAEWAVIEHIECREMTCEVAGYHVGESDVHPPDLVQDVDRSIWRHEEFRVFSTRGRSEGGMRRFILIITGYPYSDRSRPPMPLNQDF
jgi:hypothetical protein